MSFYLDVIQPSPLFATTVRVSSLDLLEPVTRGRVQKIIQDAAALGINLAAFETYRSQQRQEMLWTNGATELKTVGVHHFGLACDLVVRVGGDWSWKMPYDFLGPLAAKYSLVWGGSWHFRDSDHVQRVLVEDQARLLNGTWYPDDDYDPARATGVA